MDVQRPDWGRRRRLRRAVLGAVALTVLGIATAALATLSPAVPGVARSTVWIGTVDRGPLLREVRGPGSLVPEVSAWIPAATEGRVERLNVLPGTEVEGQTVIVELANPALELASREAEARVREAEADLESLRVRLQTERLDRQAAAAAVSAEYRRAELQVRAQSRLAADGLVAELTLELSRVREQELAQRVEIERQRGEIALAATQARLAAQRALVERLRATATHRRHEVEGLRVQAGTDGVLQQLLVEVGQSVGPGDNLARVAEPGRLKARVRLPENRVQDVVAGQRASVVVMGQVVAGRVATIAPAVTQGSVLVDVVFDGELPRGARSDLSIEGGIELERLNDVLHVQRPAFADGDRPLRLFRLEPDGRSASRTPVTLGRGSTRSVEVVAGLFEGDQVILSDMSRWDRHERIRLN